MHVGFLFNHYVGHQVYHSAPVAFALSTKYPKAQVSIIVADPKQLAIVRNIANDWPNHNCQIIQAHVPFYAKVLDKIIGKFVLIRKWAVLHSNKNLFKQLDVIVVPEKTTLALRKDPDLAHLKMVRIRHGAGDRNISFGPEQNLFDLLLAPGEEVRQRLIKDAGVAADKIIVVGYPKFDVLTHHRPESIFQNDNPVVVYNPHYKKNESSYQQWGKEVLEFFKNNPQYNLIFAPHVLLYLRKWRHGAFDVSEYGEYPNIYIDTGSSKSLDMTYIRQADIYLGDVSSQVYEFMETPRPCIFLNPHGFNWKGNKIFRYWTGGPVIEDIKDLPTALHNAFKDHDEVYEPIQESLFNSTFSLTGIPSCERSADAIITKFAPELLEKRRRTTK